MKTKTHESNDERTKTNWNQETVAAYEAAKAGKACPNDFYAAYIQGLGKVGPGHELCFYVPGVHNVIDVVMPDGTGAFSEEPLEKIQIRYPGAVVIGFDIACKLIQEVDAKRYNIGQFTKSTEAEFFEMLECLPPMGWHCRNNKESFLMSELTCGAITQAFVRIDKDYYSGHVTTNTKHEDLLQMVADSAK